MMAGEKADVLLLGPKKAPMVDQLSAAFNLHMVAEAKDFDAFDAALAPRIRAIAISETPACERQAPLRVERIDVPGLHSRMRPEDATTR